MVKITNVNKLTIIFVYCEAWKASILKGEMYFLQKHVWL